MNSTFLVFSLFMLSPLVFLAAESLSEVLNKNKELVWISTTFQMVFYSVASFLLELATTTVINYPWLFILLSTVLGICFFILVTT